MYDQNPEFLPVWGNYDQLQVRYDPAQKAVWYSLDPHQRPCFNLELLSELTRFQGRIQQINRYPDPQTEDLPIQYMVLGSCVPGVFNLGGDLHLFFNLIEAQDRESLSAYGKACIDVLYPNAINFGQDLTTVSLVQGDALGGGFEAAISSNVVIAEESAKFGLPEILFNLIPGMGAYSLLIRRTTPEITNRIITGGQVYSAQQMLDLGLLEVVVPDGEGENAVVDFIQQHSKKRNAYNALARVRQCVQPLTYEELMEVVDIWVDAALRLSARDMRMIKGLVRAQNLRAARSEAPLKALEGHG